MPYSQQPIHHRYVVSTGPWPLDLTSGTPSLEIYWPGLATKNQGPILVKIGMVMSLSFIAQC